MQGNHWLKEADIQEFNAQWEQDMGWKHLDPERYCQEKMIGLRQVAASLRSANKPLLECLISPINKSAFSDDDKQSALVDPDMPRLTDDSIMLSSMKLSYEQAAKLKEFMRLQNLMNKFHKVKDELTGPWNVMAYHISKYDGEFNNRY